ncbi:hypothetical protein [Rubrivirga sp. IMCC45206]|uniref:hypothetical protein n=1 Tax=Rubrivirga sp. IMCC45206 TaxID=3391614 RepID=UPI0039900FB6
MRALRLTLLTSVALVGVATPASAQSPLDAVALALGVGADVVSVEVRAETRATLAGEAVVVPSRRTIRRQSARWRSTLGGEPRVVALTERGAVAGEGDDAVALGPSATAEVRAALWLDPIAIALRHRQLTVRDLGSGLLRIRAPRLAEPVLIKLDARARPVRLTTFLARGGDRVYVEVVLADYRVVDGLVVPHRVTLAEGGVVRGTTTVTRVTVERAGD